ncbi:MAG TPA: TonB-dependent siderophore receptor, partial [Novosphingobium sp.]|nr:TonB-dependent siderophore receptor [Novosphingobium sp.]
QYFRSLYNVERVEVLKGPGALIFGRGGSGGVINRVQKAPIAGEFTGSVSAGAGTFGAWDVTADVNAPVGPAAALRLNAYAEGLDNNRDFFGGRRYAINPYLAVDLGRWKLGLSYEHVSDDRAADRGLPSVATAPGLPNRPLAGHRDTFIGVPGVNRTELGAHIARAHLGGQLADNLRWSTTVLYGNYDKSYTNVFANGAATADNGTVALSSYSDATRRENLIAQTSLVWDFTLGTMAHKLLGGLEYADQHSANQRRNGTLSNGIFALASPAYPSVVFGPMVRNTVSNARVFSAYAQDQIAFGSHLDLVIGLRFDRFRIAGTDLSGTPRPFARTDGKVSPRVGVIVKPRENASLYASYSQSFLPRSGDQFLSLTATQANLTPERYANYEVGGKWDIDPRLNATLALFQLDRTNATTPDPMNVGTTINIGATRTRGLELALTGRLLPGLQTSAAYTWQHARLKGNDAVRLAQVPAHQLALWNRYDFGPAFGLGLGMVHQSSQYAAIRTAPETTRLPGFTRVDAAIYFRPVDRMGVQINIENLLDATYFSDAHNNNNISPGAPINARLTARVKF